MTHGLTSVLLEFGLLSTDDGLQHLHVFFGFSMCTLQTIAAHKSGLTDVLLRNASHCLLVMDCGNYMYFLVLHDCYSYLVVSR